MAIRATGLMYQAKLVISGFCFNEIANEAVAMGQRVVTAWIIAHGQLIQLYM